MKKLQLDDRTKWLLTIAGMLLLGSIVYMVTLHILTETEIEWQYPVIIGVVLLIGVVILLYLRLIQTDTKVTMMTDQIAAHCALSQDDIRDLCALIKYDPAVNKAK